MCYAGGPYCDGTAKNRYQRAAQAFKDDPSDVLFAEKKACQQDYDGTPLGQAELDKKIAKSRDKYKTAQLISRKEQAKHVYDRKLEVAKAEKRQQQEHKKQREAKIEQLRSMQQASAGSRRIAVGRVEVNESFPHPQANRLDKVSTTVDAVEAGANTASSIAQSLDVVDRQGYYYGDAAGYLGFVEQSEGELKEYYLTEKGQAFYGADPVQRQQIIRDTVNAMPLMQVYREDGEEGARDFIRDSQDSNETTAQRRLDTIKAWDKELNSDGFADSIERDQADGATRFVGASEYAREQKEKRDKPKVTERTGKVCPECFTAMSLSGVCANCDD